MTKSLDALLTEIIDYAGLFPPAELPLDTAIRSFAEHRASREAWMLGRFVCPVGRLDELAPHIEALVPEEEVFRFSVLLRGGEDGGSFRETLDGDLESIGRFLARHRGRVDVSTCEVRFPAGELAHGDVARTTAFLDDVATAIDEKGPKTLTPFYEAGVTGADWRPALAALAVALGDHNRARGALQAEGRALRAGDAGFKLRCGGMTEAAFPSPEEVAFLIATCRDHEVPMKFTAGLHHPLRHYNEGQGVTMHGFLNVFTAGVMAWGQKLEEMRIQQLLEDTAIDGFSFDEERLSWKGYTVPVELVAELRRRALLSFGSCSFDEPREDLNALGLLSAG